MRVGFCGPQRLQPPAALEFPQHDREHENRQEHGLGDDQPDRPSAYFRHRLERRFHSKRGAAVTLTILFGVVGARVAGISRPFGLLTAGAVAICGASAALAMSSVLPKGENHERDTVFAVIGVTALSTIAMIVYPLIIALSHLDHAAIGVFLGGTIHDVARSLRKR